MKKMSGVFKKAIAHGHEANELEILPQLRENVKDLRWIMQSVIKDAPMYQIPRLGISKCGHTVDKANRCLHYKRFRQALMDSLQIRELEPIQYFCHMTTTANIHKILESGLIQPRETDTPHWTALARDRNSPIGVWFSSSLYHSELPVTSQYGENRLKIPCQFILSKLISPRLYLEAFYYFESNTRNQVVRLILVDGERFPRERDWCDKKCVRRLNMINNPFLVLDKERQRFRCLKNDGKLFPYIWMEVLVVGEVEMVAIDTIEETAPSKSEPIPGKIPPLL